MGLLGFFVLVAVMPFVFSLFLVISMLVVGLLLLFLLAGFANLSQVSGHNQIGIFLVEMESLDELLNALGRNLDGM